MLLFKFHTIFTIHIEDSTSNVFFFIKLVLISWMVTLGSCLILHKLSLSFYTKYHYFNLPPNEYDCDAWTMLENIGTDRLTEDGKKKIIVSDEAHFDLGGFVNKQNCRIWVHRKPAHIHWKSDATKTRHSLVRILVQKHNWAIFLRKWARRGRYSQCR